MQIRHILLVTASAFALQAAHAQDGGPGKLDERFAAADKDHDGRLSREEANAAMPRLAKRFDEIDTQKTGYLTLDQVNQAMAQRKNK